MEKSLILLKPDCVQKKLIGDVIKRFENNGFTVRGIKMISLDDTILAEHYAHLASKPFFPDIAAFMKSFPVVALALEGENAVEKIRDLVGPTDSTKADKGTIRGDFGVDVMKNIIHASDSSENAQIELKRFFKDGEVFSY
ncbi:MAG: nucleoside-diphosphate kinase [Verrucomicrobiota bacterium]|nr:nucleoside-diphosphate kinase [Verrucomicrobiota bacterium]